MSDVQQTAGNSGQDILKSKKKLLESIRKIGESIQIKKKRNVKIQENGSPTRKLKTKNSSDSQNLNGVVSKKHLMHSVAKKTGSGKVQSPKLKKHKSRDLSSNNKNELDTTIQSKQKDGNTGKANKKHLKKTFKNKQSQTYKFLVKPSETWYNESETDQTESSNSPEKQVKGQPKATSVKFGHALELYDCEVAAYAKMFHEKNSKDAAWMEKLMKTGTLEDKMAAFVVRIQDSPFHNLHYIEKLVAMVKVQGKQQCLVSADTLRDLFLENLLPPERKLRTFESQVRVESANKEISNKHLVKWVFEDKLKKCLQQYVEALKLMSGNTVEKVRGKAIAIIYRILVSHPEQEEVLLPLLVNKLGDPIKKLASRALYYLQQLVREHPRMKSVVIDEVERLLFRNNISKRAQYYGTCFLNMINLTEEHPSLAHKLICIYVAFFKSNVKLDQLDSKMMSVLLTGMNHAFPLAKQYGFEFSENANTLFRIVQFSSFTVAVQALCVLYQVLDIESNPGLGDRFYRTLYEKLLCKEFLTSAHNTPFLNLIFKSLKLDPDINRVIGFVKRLLQICLYAPTNLACGVLMIISEVSLHHHNKILKLGGNLSEENCVQDANSEEITETNEKSNLEEMPMLKSSNVIAAKPNKDQNRAKKKSSKKTELAVVEVLNGENETETESVKTEIFATEYHPEHRSPSFCGAHLTLAYELSCLCRHFHPSVSLFAKTLANGGKIEYEGDPLKDFTLMRFLQRFSYKNPKKVKPSIGGKTYVPKGLRALAVNCSEYVKAAEGDVPAEEKFFYQYFKSQLQEGEKTVKEEGNSDLSDQEFDQLMKSHFKAGGSDEDREEELTLSSQQNEEEDLDFLSAVNLVQEDKGRRRKRPGQVSMQDDDSDEEEFGMKSKEDENDFFAPAEEFADVLEENAHGMTGPNTLINRDKANEKQLRWEADKVHSVRSSSFRKKGKKPMEWGGKKRRKF